MSKMHQSYPKVISKLSQSCVKVFPILVKVVCLKVGLKLSKSCIKAFSKLSQSSPKVVSKLSQVVPKCCSGISQVMPSGQFLILESDIVNWHLMNRNSGQKKGESLLRLYQAKKPSSFGYCCSAPSLNQLA